MSKDCQVWDGSDLIPSLCIANQYIKRDIAGKESK